MSLGKLDFATSEGRQAIWGGGFGVVTTMTWTVHVICEKIERIIFASGVKEYHKNHATKQTSHGDLLGRWTCVENGCL